MKHIISVLMTLFITDNIMRKSKRADMAAEAASGCLRQLDLQAYALAMFAGKIPAWDKIHFTLI